jgi:hypothetical protein
MRRPQPGTLGVAKGYKIARTSLMSPAMAAATITGKLRVQGHDVMSQT